MKIISFVLSQPRQGSVIDLPYTPSSTFWLSLIHISFLTFAKIPVTGVSLDTDTITGGKIGETQTLKATVTPKGTAGIGASCTDVYWYSSDENIATVDQSGVVSLSLIHI